jgi:hypothetical protein
MAYEMWQAVSHTLRPRSASSGLSAGVLVVRAPAELMDRVLAQRCAPGGLIWEWYMQSESPCPVSMIGIMPMAFMHVHCACTCLRALIVLGLSDVYYCLGKPLC